MAPRRRERAKNGVKLAKFGGETAEKQRWLSGVGHSCDGGGLRLATAAQWQAKGGADGSGAKGLRVSEKAGLVRRQPQPPSVLRECGRG